MDLDWFIFPTPDSSYTYNKIKLGELLYIPKKKLPEYETDEPVNNVYKSIPCLYIKATNNSPNNKMYAIFFHGNAEDVNLANEMLTHIKSTLSVNVIAPEFAGYGIYSGYPTEGQLFNDAVNVFDYMVQEMKINPNNIIIFGRSLGTSIATHLASKRRGAALILISPFLSIRHMIRDILGRFISFAIRDRFKSGEYIKLVESPILIIHGQIDSIIKYYHASFRKIWNIMNSIFIMNLVNLYRILLPGMVFSRKLPIVKLILMRKLKLLQKNSKILLKIGIVSLVYLRNSVLIKLYF